PPSFVVWFNVTQFLQEVDFHWGRRKPTRNRYDQIKEQVDLFGTEVKIVSSDANNRPSELRRRSILERLHQSSFGFFNVLRVQVAQRCVCPRIPLEVLDSQRGETQRARAQDKLCLL